MVRRRKLARRKKLFLFVAVGGLATGLAAVLIWPRIKNLVVNSSVTVGKPTITQSSVAALLESI